MLFALLLAVKPEFQTHHTRKGHKLDNYQMKKPPASALVAPDIRPRATLKPSEPEVWDVMKGMEHFRKHGTPSSQSKLRKGSDLYLERIESGKRNREELGEAVNQSFKMTVKCLVAAKHQELMTGRHTYVSVNNRDQSERNKRLAVEERALLHHLKAGGYIEQLESTGSKGKPKAAYRIVAFDTDYLKPVFESMKNSVY
jgi:hypothetical protein